MAKREIVIFHISEFGGHKKAAENIEEAIKYRAPQIKVSNLNGLGYFFPRSEIVVNCIYGLIIKHFPKLWGKIYDHKKVVSFLTPFKLLVNRLAFRKLKKLLESKEIICFVCTQAFPCGIVADFKKKFNLKIPLVAVVTDYYPHRFWLHPYVDKYVVACKEAKDFLVQEGVLPQKIEILGIPISLKFQEVFSRLEIAKQFGFFLDRPTILVMGGGWGIGPLREIVKILDGLDKEIQIIVVCGKNKFLYNWFKKNFRKFRQKIFYFGYINFVNKLMDFCEIIITKGGGITISEALSKGLAIIITHPIPGQEERNVNYLLEQKAILRIKNIEEIKKYVNHLLTDKKLLYNLKKKAKEVSFIDASLRIAELIFELSL